MDLPPISLPRIENKYNYIELNQETLIESGQDPKTGCSAMEQLSILMWLTLSVE